MRVLHIDLETYSDIDIMKYGMHRYIDSPNFEIMLLAYAFDDEPVRIVDLLCDSNIPPVVDWALESDEVLKMAHNAAFEINCLRKYGFDLEESQWRCTAVHSAQLGLPRSLAGVCQQLKLGEDKAKMATGKALINYFCKPCKPTKVNGKRTRNFPDHDPLRWEEFKQYCMMDVEAEREVDRRLSAFPVPQDEWDLWAVDQRINNRGALVDMDFVNHVLGIWEEGKEKLMAEAKLLTGLDNPNSRDQLKGWLGLGADETLQKADVKELIKGSECDLTTRVLEIRQELSKTSINKYTALGEATCSDGRIKGTLLFYGASRTGRWAGRVFQPQNLPQNHLDDLDAERHLVKTQDYGTLEMLYGSVADLLSQLIRTSIVAPPGKKLIVVDYSAVEARGIAWLADEKWRLDVFTGHGKIYEASAAAAFKVPIESIDKGSPLRQQGKVLELACGYGGSVGAIDAMDTKKAIPEEDRKSMVDAWRAASPKIVQMWWSMGSAAMEAIETPGLKIRVEGNAGKLGVYFKYEKGILFMGLPSGRRLAYPRAKIEYGGGKFGQDQIVFEGLDQVKNTWCKIDTYGPKIVENLVQAMCRDLLGYGIMQLENEGYPVVLHVHDEAVVEVDLDVEVDLIEEIFARKPHWAATMPHKGDGFETLVYRKD